MGIANGLHDELLRQAFDLVHKNLSNPTQAGLRRAVSSAYYSLFHLLINETVAHGSVDSSREGLARMIEHRVMAKASDRILDSRRFPFVQEDPALVEKLKSVAKAFCQLQIKRHIADYDNSTSWTHSEALGEVTTAARAFSTWDSIQDQKIAQD